MERLSASIFRLNWLPAANVYLVAAGDGLTLIDTSIGLAVPLIVRDLRSAGYAPSDLRRILITHAHPDHIGGLKDLHALSGAEVWASATEAEVIEGRIPVPRPNKADLNLLGRLMMLPEQTADAVPVARVLQPGEELPAVAPGFTVLATPGHAPDHISFWHAPERTLIGGDVMFNLLGLRLPPAAFTVDMAENIRSVGRLTELDPAVAAFGHGGPLRGQVREKIRAFARKVGAPGV